MAVLSQAQVSDPEYSTAESPALQAVVAAFYASAFRRPNPDVDLRNRPEQALHDSAKNHLAVRP